PAPRVRAPFTSRPGAGLLHHVQQLDACGDAPRALEHLPPAGSIGKLGADTYLALDADAGLLQADDGPVAACVLEDREDTLPRAAGGLGDAAAAGERV